jgi:hypothetical protein
MIYKNLLLFATVFSFSVTGKSQGLEFYGENIAFELRDSIFKVTGIYYLCNTGDKEIKQILFYPFPADSQYYGDVNFIRISTKDTLINTLRRDKGGIYFGVEIEPYKAREYIVTYQQKLLGNRAEYILETTKKWKQPIETADYIMVIPDNLKITGISYEPDSVLTINNDLIYRWHKKNFKPDRNMIVEFQYE